MHSDSSFDFGVQAYLELQALNTPRKPDRFLKPVRFNFCWSFKDLRGFKNLGGLILKLNLMAVKVTLHSDQYKI